MINHVFTIKEIVKVVESRFSVSLGIRAVKRTVIIVCLVFVGVLIGIAALNVSGVCLSSSGTKYETDDEIVNVAIESFISWQRPSGWRDDVQVGPSGHQLWIRTFIHNDENYRKYEYGEADDFRRANPDCCSITKIGKKGIKPSFFERIFGESEKFVRIEYHGLDRLPDGSSKPFTIISYYVVSNCGKLS